VIRTVVIVCVLALLSCAAWGQGFNDVLGAHDMTPMGKSTIKGRVSGSCLYCHAPHSAMAGPGTPLWNQQLSVQTYTAYTSSTYHQTGVQPPLGSTSKLCLSCHDGTVAPGQTVAYGKFNMMGSMKTTSKFGGDLRSSHPISMKTPLSDSPEINVLLSSASPNTADPAVKLERGNVECSTCHDPHVQGKDHVVQDFLVRDGSNGALCLACHDPNRVVNGNVNFLGGWAVSAHATATNTTSNQPYVGGYGTVAGNACTNCHMQHNASGPVRLLRGSDEKACLACHNGGTNLSPAAINVFAEFAKTGHPFSSGTNVHDRTESAVLNNNRHATCVDCHNPHASKSAGTAYAAPPAVRSAQADVIGISVSDGLTVMTPAINQFENCLRCHGTSTGKVADQKLGYLPVWASSAGDPLNIIPQFSASASSSHPVTHDRTSSFPQPSLRAQMLNLDGTTPGRSMGQRILCTDCHNSDDNREFGGTGANGPHGSKYSHLLERQYEFSQVALPGGIISNLFPSPDLTINGPYALCAKCHDLSAILANSSFSEHARHINDGFSCSTCHTAHGMGGQTGSISGERMVNFDVNVVASNGGAAIAYSRSTNSCSLTCHGHPHDLAATPALHRPRTRS
jgi:predicted CXXCH cytochrome family protein